jgi:hypothetical protein
MRVRPDPRLDQRDLGPSGRGCITGLLVVVVVGAVVVVAWWLMRWLCTKSDSLTEK